MMTTHINYNWVALCPPYPVLKWKGKVGTLVTTLNPRRQGGP